MCGIVGFVTDGQAPDPGILRHMSERLVHRGPDAYGSFIEGTVALGHRRLSIIDLAGGDQPMGNEDGSVQVVFNGEIYNFRELTQELKAKGHQFRTGSDTEVLVHLYEELGEEMLPKLNGMFAFALWDTRARRLLLARDRLGKKPLYYSEAVPGYRLVFASELKALMAVPDFHPAIDPQSVANFLALSYVPDPSTIYRGVRKLAPASVMTLERGRTKTQRYWSLDFTPRKISEDDAIEQVRELAADSVARRMISDVPLGAFLSGGLDSSAIVGLMSAHSPKRHHTFSIGFESPEFDESRWALMAARHNRSEHHTEIAHLGPGDALNTLTDFFDEPFGDDSAIPTLALCALARQSVTVALSGDGADEVFGGYRRYRFALLEDSVRQFLPQMVRRPFFSMAGRLYPKFDFLPQVFRAKSLLNGLADELAGAYFTSMSTFRDSGLQRLLSPDLRLELRGFDPRDAFQQRFRAVRDLPPLQQIQAVDFETYLPGDILVKVDRASMAHSMEVRSPWLDYRLVELGASFPAHHKIRGGLGKYAFRRAVSPYVPSALRNRRKMGFSTPLAAWFRTSLKPVVDRTLLDGDLEEYVNTSEIRRLWSEHQVGISDHGRKLWNLLVLSSWKRRSQNAARPAAFLTDSVPSRLSSQAPIS